MCYRTHNKVYAAAQSLSYNGRHGVKEDFLHLAATTADKEVNRDKFSYQCKHSTKRTCDILEPNLEIVKYRIGSAVYPDRRN